MCYFITIALPREHADAVRAAHASAGLSIERTTNAAALEAAGSGWTPLLVTGGGCSCGWYARPSAAGLEERLAAAKRKYERKGWSAAKIARALEAMATRPRPDEGLHATIVELLTAIASRHGAVRVWVHDFTGKVESEAYAIAGRERWPLAELPERASALDMDVVVEIVA